MTTIPVISQKWTNMSAIDSTAISKIFFRSEGARSSDPIGKYCVFVGTLSTVLIQNKAIAADKMCASTTMRKNSSHAATEFVGFFTTFLQLIIFLKWYNVPRSLSDVHLYKRLHIELPNK